MYGAESCGNCEFNYFPWQNEQRDGHKCNPEHVKKVLLSKVREKQRRIESLEEEIEVCHRKIKEYFGRIKE